MRHALLTLSLIALATTAGCRRDDAPAAPPAADATAAAPAAGQPAAPAAGQPAAPAPGAADDNLNAVVWTQRSVEYAATTTALYRAAADHLDAALAEKSWDALVPAEREGTATHAALKPAVVLDIDETVLDNSPYQARLVADGLEYNEVTWDQWVAERKAKAVPGVVDFAKAAEAKGVTLLYISNRAVHLQEATIANLRAEGLPVKDESVFLGLGTHVDGCEQNGTEKLCRRRLAGRDYRVLMQFGDQLGDFVEVVANTTDARTALLDEYRDWFGERWWMLPNPTYGSWEPALFNNAWDQPREARRQAKREGMLLSR